MKHNPQFREIEKRVYSKLSTQEKQRVNFEEYREVVKLIEERSGLSITEFYRWLSFWWLEKKGILHVGIVPREVQYMTDEELEISPDLSRHYRMKELWRKQRKPIYQMEEQ